MGADQRKYVEYKIKIPFLGDFFMDNTLSVAIIFAIRGPERIAMK